MLSSSTVFSFSSDFSVFSFSSSDFNSAGFFVSSSGSSASFTVAFFNDDSLNNINVFDDFDDFFSDDVADKVVFFFEWSDVDLFVVSGFIVTSFEVDFFSHDVFDMAKSFHFFKEASDLLFESDEVDDSFVKFFDSVVSNLLDSEAFFSKMMNFNLQVVHFFNAMMVLFFPFMASFFTGM